MFGEPIIDNLCSNTYAGEVSPSKNISRTLVSSRAHPIPASEGLLQPYCFFTNFFFRNANFLVLEIFSNFLKYWRKNLEIKVFL